MQFTARQPVVGTLPFTSINGQRGCTQSRRDDLESLFYTIIFFACGNLPWINDSIFGDHKAVLEKKTLITTEELCDSLPPPFSQFVIYVRSLGFDQKPDYKYLHTILLQCLEADKLSEAPPSDQHPPLSAKCTRRFGDRV